MSSFVQQQCQRLILPTVTLSACSCYRAVHTSVFRFLGDIRNLPEDSLLLGIPSRVAMRRKETIGTDLDVDCEHSWCAEEHGTVPRCRGQDGLELGDPTVHWDQELDIVEGHRRRHGLAVVLVVYSQVGAGGLAPPAHRQAQRDRLEPVGRHLRVVGKR